MRVLITGGAGFVGFSLARLFKARSAGAEVVAFDNLRRRGSELNLDSMRREGIKFFHGDVRNPGDLEAIEGQFDLMIEASAEPSVQAGHLGDPGYVVDTNLGGTFHCLGFARRRVERVIFLSSSRVYSIRPLRELPLIEGATRFSIDPSRAVVGVSKEGISEEFTTREPRSLYGATKLASELLVQEFADTYGLQAVIFRCSVIAGPGQFGKVDQGIFTLWVACHHYGKPLTYTGFGGEGKQVRDLLHPSDLFDLIQLESDRLERDSGQAFNVGGGARNAISLAELTTLCRETVGREVPIASQPETSAVDIPLFISDCSKINLCTGWLPRQGTESIVEQIHAWICENESTLRHILG